MSIDPILELIKERNAVEERLAAMIIDRDEWEEVAEQFAADSKAYRKERDAFKKRMRAAEQLVAEVIAGYEAERDADFDWIEWYERAKTHLEAARMEDKQ